jgi:SAM-dependent methyltransferase
VGTQRNHPLPEADTGTDATPEGQGAKSALQEALYAFPYHWLPHMDAAGRIGLGRSLDWGLDYISYMEHVVRLVARHAPASILDVGCGDGRLLDWLRRARPELAAGYTGVDTSEPAIALARVLNGSDRFRAEDVAKVEGRFDALLLVEVLEHIPDGAVVPFLEHLRARVAPGGVLIVSVPSANVPVNPKHYRHYDPPSLEDALARGGFEVGAMHFASPSGWPMRIARVLLSNRLFVLKPSGLTAAIWRMYRWSASATARNCMHLVVEARVARDR